MSTFASQTLAGELVLLVQKLQAEGSPHVTRLLPFWKNEYLEDVTACWQRMDMFRQEISKLQSTIMNLTFLILQQPTQQPVLPMSTAPQFQLDFNSLQPVPMDQLAMETVSEGATTSQKRVASKRKAPSMSKRESKSKSKKKKDVEQNSEVKFSEQHYEPDWNELLPPVNVLETNLNSAVPCATSSPRGKY